MPDPELDLAFWHGIPRRSRTRACMATEEVLEQILRIGAVVKPKNLRLYTIQPVATNSANTCLIAI